MALLFLWSSSTNELSRVVWGWSQTSRRL